MHSSKNCPRTYYGDTTGTKMKEYNCYLLDLQDSRKCIYFPGGKLDAEIGLDKLLCTVEWDYPQFHLTMHCFMAPRR